MASNTVAQFATELKLTPPVLLEQLRAAGVAKHAESDELSEDDKAKLLDALRKAHGGQEIEKRKITLTRRSTSAIKQADATGKARTIQVEVRKKRVFVKRDADGEAEAVAPAAAPVIDEAELARREEEARRQAEFVARQVSEARERSERAQREIDELHRREREAQDAAQAARRRARRRAGAARCRRPGAARPCTRRTGRRRRGRGQGCGRRRRACRQRPARPGARAPRRRRGGRGHQEHDGGPQEGGQAGSGRGHAAQAGRAGHAGGDAGGRAQGRQEAGRRQGSQVGQAGLELVRGRGQAPPDQDPRRCVARRRRLARPQGPSARRRARQARLRAGPRAGRARGARCPRPSPWPNSPTRCRSRPPRSSRC